MGLSITVGLLSELTTSDPRRSVEVVQDFQTIAVVMRRLGLPPHQEPVYCEVWGGDGWGYGGLHALGQVSVLTWQGQPIPRDRLLDGEDIEAEMDFFAAHERAVLNRPNWLQRALLGRTAPAPLPFAHLTLHGDGTGFYVPTDFNPPILHEIANEGPDHLWPLGSTQRLNEELAVLAAVLEIPPELTTESDALIAALDHLETSPPTTGPLWRAQPIATYSLLLLQEACAHSLKTGAAICYG